MCPISGQTRVAAIVAYTASAVVVGICRDFESNFALTIHPNMRF